MNELGWIEGRTVAIEYRWSEARPRARRRVCGRSASKSRHMASGGPRAPSGRERARIIEIVDRG
jgi:hypothetical protein